MTIGATDPVFVQHINELQGLLAGTTTTKLTKNDIEARVNQINADLQQSILATKQYSPSQKDLLKSNVADLNKKIADKVYELSGKWDRFVITIINLFSSKGTVQINTRLLEERVDSLAGTIHVPRRGNQNPVDRAITVEQSRGSQQDESIKLLEKEPDGAFTKIPKEKTAEGMRYTLLVKHDGVVKKDDSYEERYDKIDGRPDARTKEQFLQDRLDQLVARGEVLPLRKQVVFDRNTTLTGARSELEKMPPGSYSAVAGKGNETVLLLRGPSGVEQHTFERVERSAPVGVPLTKYIPPFELRSIEEKKRQASEIEKLNKMAVGPESTLTKLQAQFKEGMGDAYAIQTISGRTGQYKLIGKPKQEGGFTVYNSFEVTDTGRISSEGRIFESLTHLLAAHDLGVPLHQAQIERSIGLLYLESDKNDDKATFELQLQRDMSNGGFQAWHTKVEPGKMYLTTKGKDGQLTNYVLDASTYTEQGDYKIKLKTLQGQEVGAFAGDALAAELAKKLGAKSQGFVKSCAELSRFAMKERPVLSGAVERMPEGVSTAYALVASKQEGHFELVRFEKAYQSGVDIYGLDQDREISYSIEVLQNGALRASVKDGRVREFANFEELKNSLAVGMSLKNFYLDSKQVAEARAMKEGIKQKATTAWCKDSAEAENVFMDAERLGLAVPKNQCLFYEDPDTLEVGIVFKTEKGLIQKGHFNALDKTLTVGEQVIPFDPSAMNQFSLIEKAKLTPAGIFKANVAAEKKKAEENYKQLVRMGSDIQKINGFFAGELTEKGAKAELERLSRIAGKGTPVPGSWLVVQQEEDSSYKKYFGLKALHYMPLLGGYAQRTVQARSETGTYLFSVVQPNGTIATHKVTINPSEKKYILGDKKFDTVDQLLTSLKVKNDLSLKELRAKDTARGVTRQVLGAVASWAWNNLPSWGGGTAKPPAAQPVVKPTVVSVAAVKVEAKASPVVEQPKPQVPDAIAEKLEVLGKAFLNTKLQFWGTNTKSLINAQKTLLSQLKQWKDSKTALSKENAEEALALLLRDESNSFAAIGDVTNLPLNQNKQFGIVPPSGMNKPERDAILTWVWNQAKK